MMGVTAIRVVVLYNEPVLPETHREAVSERAIAAAVDFVIDGLRRSGAHVLPLPTGSDFVQLAAELHRSRPHVVVNLFEGLADSPYTEASVAGLLERLDVAFTGSTATTLELARNKPRAKMRMAGQGLPTPRWQVVDSPVIGAVTLAWPVIVKPAHEDASLGIDQESVVVDRTGLKARVRELQARYGGEVLLEEYVAGREVSIAILESPHAMALPTIEFEFDLRSGEAWPILTYDSKWQPDSTDYEMSRANYKVDLPPPLQMQLNDLALRAYGVLGCRDYARVDFRIADDGQPYILEVNPNPDLSPTACFCGALRSANLSPVDWMLELVEAARHRRHDRKADHVRRRTRHRIARG